MPAYAAEGVDEVVRATNAGEESVAANSNYLAWDQVTRKHPNRANVFVKPDGSSKFRVNAKGTEGGMGGIDGHRLVYQQFEGRQSNIRMINLKTKDRNKLPGLNTRNWEYQPTIDGKWVMFVRLNTRTGKRKVILFNKKKGTSRALDSVRESSYLQPGQIAGKYLVWVKWNPNKKSKVFLYNRRSKEQWRVPNNDAYNWASSVTPNGTVYFGRTGRNCGSNAKLMRWRRGSSPVKLVDFPNGIDISDSWVFVNAAGKLHVYHNRLDCGDLPVGADLYKYVDPFTVTLTAAKDGNRDGTVTGSGISCGSDCTQDYEPGADVTLTAAPEPGARFAGWSDPSCPDAPTCTVTMNTNKTITATFRP